MGATCRLLDAVKEKMGISSDYALADQWKIGRQVISRYRRGATISDDKALELAAFLGRDPARVLLDVQAERAENSHHPAVAETLRDALRRLGGIAAMFCLFILSGAPSRTEAAQVQISSFPASTAAERQLFDSNTHYATLAARIAAWLRQMLCRYQFHISPAVMTCPS